MSDYLRSKTGAIFPYLRVAALCVVLSLPSIISINLIFGESNNGKDSSPQTATSEAIPAWLENYMGLQVRGTGKWIAENPHKNNEKEPDAYGMEYSWGAGKKSIQFRLFAITNHKESATMWEYRVFWHPGEKKVLVYQWGSDGTLGYGEVKPVDISKGQFEVEQVFFDPTTGSSFKSRHESIETDTERQTKSFVYNDGIWKESGTYTWRLSK
ncbi:hypothetical protein L0244_03170 [bacterium]|nr:hypothetical protein [bacterium]MCI0611968.1 hypothetical protein [bacterium]